MKIYTISKKYTLINAVYLLHKMINCDIIFNNPCIFGHCKKIFLADSYVQSPVFKT